MDTPASTPPATPRRGRSALAWLLLPLLLAAGGWFGWQAWQARQLRQHDADLHSAQRLAALEARVDALRGDQRAQSQRLQQADATNRVLRDELLGLGQRAALIEDNVAKLADPRRNAAQALRLDELEVVLVIAQERLQLAGDLDGARKGYALAAGLLDAIDDPAYLNLQQALAQERAALDALGADPRAVAADRLQAFAAALQALPLTASTPVDARLPWWRRAFSRLIHVRPTTADTTVDAGDRSAGLAALQLELTLAQAAVERRDREGYRKALARTDAWMSRLWPDSAALRRQQAELRALSDLPLAIDLPTLGTTLQQLRAMRAAK